MKAYLINLDRSDDRLQRMKGQFAKAGLEFVRVPAVDGRAMNHAELAEIKRNPGWEQPLSLSEIGCFLSHRRCYEQIVQAGERFAAVFEDDIAFSRNAQQFFADDGWIPDDADIIKLETHGRKVLTGEPVAQVAGGYEVARLLSQNILSAGYIISARCAAYLLEHMNDAAAPMDHFLFTPACGFFRQLKIYQVNPVICG
ncbi:glycosyltransferase family 25 protein [Pseudochrobactrum sp. HB0163]|uniref:glycosyltransferase family 25 protein n=1 Tax=Pseudochrobactrum sp. HB0163 TaxID=3450708 RepID=UPI003F6DA6C8